MAKTDAEYLKAPNNCPICDSPEIEAAGIDVDFNGATQQITCLACEAVWYDVYRLIGFELA